MKRILTTQQMAVADRLTIASGVDGFDLMERAGAAVAREALKFPVSGPVAVFCGPGNNGGDGFVCARHMADAGRDVDLYLFGDRNALRGDAAQAAAAWPGDIHPLNDVLRRPPSLIVDALFGAGLTRPLEGIAAQLSQMDWPLVVSVDVPSGLEGDTGRVRGSAFRADVTVTFAAPKPAHIVACARDFVGRVLIEDIGISDDTLAAAGGSLFENVPENWLSVLPWPNVDAHKHARGRLICVTGGVHSTGAARLAARAGLRSGAGLVTLLSPPSAVLVNAIASTAVMVEPFDSVDALKERASAADAVVIGPAAGLSTSTKKNVLAVLASKAATVLDADGLTVFQEDPSELFSALRSTDVITPHAGEFERLFPGALQASATRIDAALSAAKTAGSIVLLKGPDTVIAAPDGRASVNVCATPFLATAGAGDVLAGIIGGLLAQGLASWEAACAGAWIHGSAGLQLGPGLIAEDLESELPSVLKDLFERSGADGGTRTPTPRGAGT